jgi:hypothetical protein
MTQAQKTSGIGGKESRTGDVSYLEWYRLLKLTPELSCGHCGERSSCSCLGEGCGQRYCSRECQVADWPRHKIRCRAAASAGPGDYVGFGKGMFTEFVASGDHGDDAFCEGVLRDMARE